MNASQLHVAHYAFPSVWRGWRRVQRFVAEGMTTANRPGKDHAIIVEGHCNSVSHKNASFPSSSVRYAGVVTVPYTLRLQLSLFVQLYW